MSLPSFSVRNPVMVNMLTIVTLIAGAVFAVTLVREMFPESRPNAINIMAVYPAVQPQELERAVTIKIEEAVRDVDGVEKVDSTISEGLSSTKLTLYNSVVDVDAVLQEVKNEVDALQDLPDDLEKITVFKVEPTLPVIMVAIHGPGSEAQLKAAAREVRDDLLELPGVSDVQMIGSRPDEISIEVSPERLLEYDITFSEVAAAIRQTNLDISAGNLRGDRSQISVRTLGEELEGRELEDIEVRSLPDGRTILLRDVATIRDEFVETDVRSFWTDDGNPQRSINLIVQKTPAQDAIQISTLIKAYVAGKEGRPFDPLGLDRLGELPWYERPLVRVTAFMTQTIDRVAGRPDPQAIYQQSRASPLEHNFQLGLHTDLARFVEGRLDLLVRNGRAGLVLVLVCLMMFLNFRVAFWTAVGLPVSFLGTFVVMALFGVSINLLSMFGLIIVLGIIVDDAIVIGENIYRHVEEGMPSMQAAVQGAEEVQWPVIVAVSTTMAAFAPLLFLKGQIGDFMRQLPLVVIAALSVSLMEALVVLPAHLRHLPARKVREHALGLDAGTKQDGWLKRLFRPLILLQEGFMNRLAATYSAVLRRAIRWRYVSLAIAVGTCIATFGLIIGITDRGPTLGNIVEWEFIQKMDAESMFAQLEMPVGSTAEEVEVRLKQIAEFAGKLPEVESTQLDVASVLNVADVGATGGEQQSHLGQVWIELMAADRREELGLRSSDAVLAQLREDSSQLTGVNAVKWEVMSGGPGGKDIEIRFTGDDFDELKAVVDEFKTELATYAGVVDLDDDLDDGKREVQLTLRAAARPTGITRQQLGSHVRGATYGVEARRLTRNREDVKIMVRYPEATRDEVANIESMWIPSGPASTNSERGWVPMSEVADLNETRSFTQIHRSQQRRALKVLGDIDTLVAKPEDVLGRIRREFVPQVQERHPQVRIDFLGSQEEQSKSFSSLRLAMPISLLLIYMMLAGLFRSYAQPIVVMSAIPFAFQGAIIGHWLTGNPATFLSAIGMVALTGIVVNDSLVLVDFINNRVRAGMDEFEASVQGATLRLRPILLTTLTTVAGLAPMMFEKSFQAKFLIPMAVTLTFGLLFATILTLLIVPVLNMIFFDVRSMVRLLFFGSSEPEHDELPTPVETVTVG
ncbi:MAG: efflux RND transporter permease subunit [Planctomycetaceae bacterium]